MDNLERFILENRESFDNEVPGLRVWAGIDKHLEHRPSPRIVWMKRLRIAASVALLLMAGGAAGAYLAGPSSSKVKSLADISPEHAEMERYFNTQIQDKMALLASYEQNAYVKEDIRELEALYEQMKLELSNAPEGAQEKIIQAMINNYQTKIDILERVLEKVQTTIPSNSKTADNEYSI